MATFRHAHGSVQKMAYVKWFYIIYFGTEKEKVVTVSIEQIFECVHLIFSIGRQICVKIRKMHLHAFTYVKFDGIMFTYVIFSVSGGMRDFLFFSKYLLILNTSFEATHASGYVNLF